MKTALLHTDIKRESGYLYFCGTDKKGNIVVYSTKMHRKGPVKKHETL